MSSAPDFSASAAHSRSNAISCSASSRSPSIRSSVSSTTGPHLPDPPGFTPARPRKIHLAQGVMQEAHPTEYFHLAAALVQLDRLDEAHFAVQAGFALNPTYAISRARAAWTARSDDPTFLAEAERVLEAMRKAGVPEQ